jgi:hypothetical protein
MRSHHGEDVHRAFALHSHIIGKCKVQVLFREEDPLGVDKIGCCSDISPVEAISTGPEHMCVAEHMVGDSIDETDLMNDNINSRYRVLEVPIKKEKPRSV